MINPKRTTELLLANTYVRKDYLELPAGSIFYDLMATYAPDVLIEQHYPEQFWNPVVTARFPRIPLQTALADVCKYCGVTCEVTDRGTVKIAPSPRREEAMRHAVVIEPDNRTWQKTVVDPLASPRVWRPGDSVG